MKSAINFSFNYCDSVNGFYSEVKYNTSAYATDIKSRRHIADAIGKIMNRNNPELSVTAGKHTIASVHIADCKVYFYLYDKKGNPCPVPPDMFPYSDDWVISETTAAWIAHIIFRHAESLGF